MFRPGKIKPRSPVFQLKWFEFSDFIEPEKKLLIAASKKGNREACPCQFPAPEFLRRSEIVRKLGMTSIPIRDLVCLEPFKNVVQASEESAKPAAVEPRY